MQSKVNGVVIGLAVVALLAFCAFMWRRANADSPNQLAPTDTVYKPGYTGGARPRPGSGAHGGSPNQSVPTNTVFKPGYSGGVQARPGSTGHPVMTPHPQAVNPSDGTESPLASMGSSLIRLAPGCSLTRRFAASLVAATLVATLPGCHPKAPLQAAGADASAGGFVDITAASGLHYTWTAPGKRPLNILQTIGNGCALLDYDNDGNLDILLVGPKLALYRGDGKGRFTDVTHEAGLDRLSGHFLGCAVGDYDNDGYDDIYVSGYHTGLLLHNEHGMGFKDVTARAGLKPQPWGTSCAFAETRPGSGRLDLYVGNYAEFGPTTKPQLCQTHGVMTSCSPKDYTPLKGVLYLNDGNGRFHDGSAGGNLLSAHGRALGVAFADYDGYGAPGLALANDELLCDLYAPTSNTGGHYTNIGQQSGTAVDRDGNIHGGMGLDWGDCDNDGRLDLFVATYENEVKCLYKNEGGGTFREVGLPSTLGEICAKDVAFGCKLLDYDNDGWLDIAIANGHVEDNVEQITPGHTYRQTAKLVHNSGTAPLAFTDASTTAGGAGFSKPIVGRGLASGDFDNDGRVDLLIVDSEGSPLLLHNEIHAPGRHFLGLKLIGTKSNRDGYGAIVTVMLSDGRKLTRLCHADGSYLSSSDSRVHIGLGVATSVATLSVHWPSGRTDTWTNVLSDRYLTAREGAPSLPN